MLQFLIEENMLLVLSAGIQVIGDIMIAFVVMRVHAHIRTEQSIDADVVQAIKKERTYIAIGIALVLIGFLSEAFIRLELLSLLM